MALPSSGPLSMNAIAQELQQVYDFTTPYSLRTLSNYAGFNTPDAISEFYGYNASGGATTYTASCTFSVRTGGGGGGLLAGDEAAGISADMQVYKNGELEIRMRETGTDSFTFSAGDTLEMYSTAEGTGEILISHKILNGAFFYLDEDTAADGSVELSSTITAPANNIEIRFNIK